MQRKLIRVGSSAAVLIPKALLDEQGWKIGDVIHIEASRQEADASRTQIDPAVIAWADKLIERYKPMLKKLASS